MTDLPAHVVETVETTRTFRCRHCRIILGTYEDPGHAEELLSDWLARHLHAVPSEPP